MGSLADHIMLAIPGPGSVNEKLIAFFGGGGVLQPQSVSTSALVVRALAGQTADLTQWQNSGGSVLASISSSGRLIIDGIAQAEGGHIASGVSTPSSSATLYIKATSAGVVGLVVRGNTAQTASLQEWQDSAGSILTSVTTAGLPKWNAAANQQTTVGLAGAASAPPLTPTKYLKVVDSAGTTLVIPAYNP